MELQQIARCFRQVFSRQYQREYISSKANEGSLLMVLFAKVIKTAWNTEDSMKKEAATQNE